MAGCILQWMVHNGSRVFGADASNKTLTLLCDPEMSQALMQVCGRWKDGRAGVWGGWMDGRAGGC